MKKVFIDTDPGIDDAVAIVLAHQMGLDIKGISLVSGNVHRDQGLVNVFRLSYFLGKDFPIYTETDRPQVYPLSTGVDIHGGDGLGGTDLPYEDLDYQENGMDALIALLKKEPVTIYALGPLTNLALALKKDREAFKNARLIVMGGNAYVPGNVTDLAEYNFWCDPHSAQDVFENFPGLVDLVPLDLTQYGLLTQDRMESIEKENPKIGKFIQEITKAYLDIYQRKDGVRGCILHDPLTLLVDKYQEKFTWEEVDLKVETEEERRGVVQVDKTSSRKNCRLYTGVDPDFLMDVFQEELLRKRRD